MKIIWDDNNALNFSLILYETKHKNSFLILFCLVSKVSPLKLSKFSILNDNNAQGERGKHFALLSKQYPNIEMNNHILLKAYVRQSSGVVLGVSAWSWSMTHG